MINISFIKSPNQNYLGDRIIFSDRAILGNNGDFKILKEDLTLPNIYFEVSESSIKVTSEYEINTPFFLQDREVSFPFRIKKGEKISFDEFEIQIKDFTFEPSSKNYKLILQENLSAIKKDPKRLKFVEELYNYKK